MHRYTDTPSKQYLALLPKQDWVSVHLCMAQDPVNCLRSLYC